MPGGVDLHRSMTLKQRITLGLAAFLLALAAQIFLSFYQSGTVLPSVRTTLTRLGRQTACSPSRPSQPLWIQILSGQSEC